MNVPRPAGTIRDLSPQELGFDPYDCIREADTAYSQEGGLTILYGNLAPRAPWSSRPACGPRCCGTPGRP
jgi:hypothetical protein